MLIFCSSCVSPFVLPPCVSMLLILERYSSLYVQVITSSLPHTRHRPKARRSNPPWLEGYKRLAGYFRKLFAVNSSQRTNPSIAIHLVLSYRSLAVSSLACLPTWVRLPACVSPCSWWLAHPHTCYRPPVGWALLLCFSIKPCPRHQPSPACSLSPLCPRCSLARLAALACLLSSA